MKWYRTLWIVVMGVALFNHVPLLIAAEDTQTPVHPMALLQFEERGPAVRGYGTSFGDLLFAALAKQPQLVLVEREDVNRIFQEQELSLSGMVRPEDAVQVGQLTGAKILVSGSLIQVDRALHVVARLIGTETSRVIGASVKGQTSDDLGGLADQLAEAILDTLATRAHELVAPVVTPEQRIAGINEQLGDAPRPALRIRIAERHVNRAPIDPAAETEFMVLARETGFTLIDATSESAEEADILIEGEGFSELAMRRGSLVSVKARLEVKAVERETGRVLAVDRQTVVQVDLAEEIAGKSALQEAAARIATRMLPELVR